MIHGKRYFVGYGPLKDQYDEIIGLLMVCAPSEAIASVASGSLKKAAGSSKDKNGSIRLRRKLRKNPKRPFGDIIPRGPTVEG